MGGEVVNLGAQGLNLRPRNSALPFAARRTLFNNQAQSAERRYANCELSLDRVVAIAKASATSINDVLMTAIDAALHSYLELRQQPTGKPLVAIDTVGAGLGEIVLVVSGSSARQTDATTGTPVDAVIMGIVDCIDLDGQRVFEKG